MNQAEGPKPESIDLVESKPVESMQTEPATAESTPKESIETESTPAESTPAESTPAESTPAESTPAESTPAESTPAESKSESMVDSIASTISSFGNLSQESEGDSYRLPFAKHDMTDYKHADMNQPVDKHRLHLDKVNKFNKTLKGRGPKYYSRLSPHLRHTMKKEIVEHLMILINESTHKNYENEHHHRDMKKLLELKKSLDKHYSLIFPKLRVSKKSKSSKSSKSKRSTPQRSSEKQPLLYKTYDSNRFENMEYENL